MSNERLVDPQVEVTEVEDERQLLPDDPLPDEVREAFRSQRSLDRPFLGVGIDGHQRAGRLGRGDDLLRHATRPR